MQVRALRCRSLRWVAVALLALAAGVASVLGPLLVADVPSVDAPPAAESAGGWLSGDGVGDPEAIGLQLHRGPVVERATDARTRLVAVAIAVVSAIAAGFVGRGRWRRVAARGPVASGSVLQSGPVRRRAPPPAALAA